MASFGSSIGGGSAIEQAMARRGMGGAGTAQMSPAAVGSPNPLPTTGAATPQGGIPAPQGSVSAMGPTSSESQLIIKALTSRINSISKQEEQGVRPV